MKEEQLISLLKDITDMENSIISEFKIEDKETHNELTIKVQFPKIINKK